MTKSTANRWSNQFRQRMAGRNDSLPMEKRLQRRLELLSAMHDQGVKFLAGTDVANPYVFPGFSLHDELEYMVKAGFTPIEALQTATINPAIFLHKENELGTVEKGKLADLVLLDFNPLENISNTKKIFAVILDGKLFERRDLDKMLDEVKALVAK
jgi:imidazolonepropionase-like amidohydrolase